MYKNVEIERPKILAKWKIMCYNIYYGNYR